MAVYRCCRSLHDSHSTPATLRVSSAVFWGIESERRFRISSSVTLAVNRAAAGGGGGGAGSETSSSSAAAKTGGRRER